MNDYNNILIKKTTNGETSNNLLTIDDVDFLHNDQLQWLQNSIADCGPDDKFVVITHHLPTPHLSHPKYARYETLNSAFYTNLLKTGVFDPRIKLWVCGHTHTKMQYTDPTSGIQFCVNPIGYSGENIDFSVMEYDIGRT